MAAILANTNRVIFLEEGDVVDVRPTRVTVTGVDGSPRERLVTRVDWTPEAAEKGGFDHFMLKEIHEQPQALRQCLAGRLGQGATIRTDELAGMAAALAAVDLSLIHISEPTVTRAGRPVHSWTAAAPTRAA